MKRRLLNLLVALDQLIFCLLTLGHSNPDETMSAAAYRLEQAGRLQGRIFRPAIDWAFTWAEREHCQKSYLAEQYRLI